MATTWVQIVKAVLLLSGAALMSCLMLAHFGFSPRRCSDGGRVHSEDVASGARRPGQDPSAISLGLALMFGTAGLPHILMRFFTVRRRPRRRGCRCW